MSQAYKISPQSNLSRAVTSMADASETLARLIAELPPSQGIPIARAVAEYQRQVRECVREAARLGEEKLGNAIAGKQ